MHSKALAQGGAWALRSLILDDVLPYPSEEGRLCLSQALGAVIRRAARLETLTLHLEAGFEALVHQPADHYMPIFEALESTVALRELSLHSGIMWRLGGDELQRCLLSNHSLTLLDLSHNFLMGDGIEALAAYIRSSTNIQTLRVDSALWDAPRPLLESARDNHGLRTLDLSNNQLLVVPNTDQDPTAPPPPPFDVLGGVLSCATLTVLDLHSADVGGDFGAQSLSLGLCDNSTLVTLNLGGTRIGPEGAVFLAGALEVNTTLTDLNLRSCPLGDAGVTALAEMLACNSALRALSLTNTQCGADGATAVASSLRLNRGLTEVSMGHNVVTDAGLTALAGALRGTPRCFTFRLQGLILMRVWEGIFGGPPAGGAPAASNLEIVRLFQEEWREVLLAFAMGTHPRLGGGSQVLGLSDNLLSVVGEQYWGRPAA